MSKIKKIDKLTPEQIAKFPEYVKKWTDIGLSVEPTNKERVRPFFDSAYINGGLTPPKDVIWLKSPMGIVVLYSIWNNVEQNVWKNVEPNIRQNVEQNVRQNVEHNVWQKKLKMPIWCYGQIDANWLSFYEFFKNECGLSVCEKLNPLNSIAIDCHWWSPFKNVVLASEKPVAIHLDAQGRLHSFDSLAIEYGDGWGVYSIYGRRCPERVIKTPVNQIPIEWWADEENVETRLAVEQKIGTARILKELNAKQVHSRQMEIPGPENKLFLHRYNVVEMAFKNGDKRKVLEMVNPSTGEIHREWVPPECDTVEKALAFRNGTEALPEVLT